MAIRKTRLRLISQNDKLIIDDATGQVIGFAPDSRSPMTMMAYVEENNGEEEIKSASTGDSIGSLGGASIQNGLAIVSIDGSNYALLPVGEDGSLHANVTHRKGLQEDLLSLSGGDGEIGIATDTKSLIIFNGTEGGAQAFRRLNNAEGLGPDSLAIGVGASTLPGASRSMSLGSYAKAEIPGQVALGGQIDGVSKSFVTLGILTTTDDFVQMSTDGNTSGLSNNVRLVRDGIFDVTAVVLARKTGTNSWARFEQRGVVRKTGSSTVMSTPTVPTPDINSGLTGITATLGATGGGLIYVAVEGLAAEAVQWGAFLTINALNLSV